MPDTECEQCGQVGEIGLLGVCDDCAAELTRSEVDERRVEPIPEG